MIECDCDRAKADPDATPTGTLVLADKSDFDHIGFCKTCRWRDTPMCNIHGGVDARTRREFVSGAFPWECIYCNYRNGKQIKDYEHKHTYARCPHICKENQHAPETEKWGCPKFDLDGEEGRFCKEAVRCIDIRGETTFDYMADGACCRYEPVPSAAHASSLWDKVHEWKHPMSFKCVRDYAKEHDCQTLHDLLMAFDANEFRTFCRERHDRTVNSAMRLIEEYAEVFGWFWIGDHEAFAEGTREMQIVRARKAVAAVANAKAKKEEEKAKSRRKPKAKTEGGAK